MKNQKILFGLLIIFALLIIGCENNKELFNPVEPENARSIAVNDQISDLSNVPSVAAGAVYTMTNDATGNEVIGYYRNLDGTLRLLGYYSTKGAGSGSDLGPLGSLGSIAISNNYAARTIGNLFVVNAGSNQISSFAIQNGKLDLRDVVDSGGKFPVSLTVHGNLLYVLNARGKDAIRDRNDYYGGNITGFRVADDGQLKMIPQSTRPLSQRGEVAPAQIQFSKDGKLLAVTEKQTNSISIYVVGESGLTDGPITYRSSGQTPVGFAFNIQGKLLVAEAFNNGGSASAASLYEAGWNGELQLLTSSVGTKQTASSSTVITDDGRHGYVANTLSGTISLFSIEGDALKLLDNISGIGEESLPMELALSQDSRYMYVLNTGRSVGAYEIQDDGSLSAISGSIDKRNEMGIQGLAAY